ncbi:hypothetical protein C8N40_10777 [Pontibacter mucosus]|uniref:Uncharacterized protein n=1 Tax=Pontibacter mucosus TaxID=1649266 RepID=A0A2T5YFE8_9BACT|nr:hypothetical protein C8N40_10777 [Pontibacter mucosus]
MYDIINIAYFILNPKKIRNFFLKQLYITSSNFVD